MVKKFDIKSIMKIDRKDNFLKELDKEMKEDYRNKIKNKIKQKMKEIAMTKDILKKQEKELDDYLSGKRKVLTKEEYLYE